tara:strand:+ start:2536 stop:3300 length:765 start_codon:yes stop_codon:yes gene_type:complete
MKKILQASLIVTICLGISSTAYGLTDSTNAVADGLVSPINDVTYAALAGTTGRLDDLNTQDYKKWLIGNITVDNNNAAGYTLAVKSTQAFEGSTDPDTNNQTAASSRMVHSDYKNASSSTKHRFVEGAFIEYNVTVLPKGVSTQTAGSPEQEGYNNDNSANDYTTNNIHGCYADKADSFSGLTSTSHAVFSVEKSLAHTETMTFNLAAAPCVSRTGGVTATADFEYDLLITTNSNKKLLAGSYSDTIELILTDI